MRAPAVLLLLLLCACKDHPSEDFNRAWASYQPARVGCADNANC
jgi:hypothetical protein